MHQPAQQNLNSAAEWNFGPNSGYGPYPATPRRLHLAGDYVPHGIFLQQCNRDCFLLVCTNRQQRQWHAAGGSTIMELQPDNAAAACLQASNAQ
jgi:hypothetical protein